MYLAEYSHSIRFFMLSGKILFRKALLPFLKAKVAANPLKAKILHRTRRQALYYIHPHKRPYSKITV